ncbi:MAG TPA: N-acyl homoserine lactonase family protein [Candidatus Binataceae bacterium]|nr:N-acyl homoserine lactonase family protein [Candidatus Binataceae bacterium]
MPEGKARKMWALPGAMVDIPRSMLMLGAEPAPVTVPTPSFLIEHPKGLVLFDSGCNPKILDDPVGYWGPMAAGMPFKWSKQETLDKQIERVGYKASDVKYVVLSHGHLDHAGGLAYFPDAKFIVGAGELRYAYWPDPDRRWAFILEDFLPTRGFQWIELGQDQDLFGDGAVTFLYTPGHTPGECSIVVNLPNRRVLVTGDTVHTRAAFENEVSMPFSVNHMQAMASLKRIKSMRDLGGAQIWITHDPDDWRENPHQID